MIVLNIGTWLGVSKEGRLAILTNYREASSALAIGEKSRGAMITSFLASPDPVDTPTSVWLRKVLDTGEMKGVGGFSMMCGLLRPKGENLEGLAIISNRTPYRDDGVESTAHWIGEKKGETRGLSNSLFDSPWQKVKLGEQLLEETIQVSVEEEGGVSEDEFLKRCFAVLSHNTLPLISNDDTYEIEMNALELSIFIPPFDAAAEHATTPHGHRAQTPDIPEEQLPPHPEDIASGRPENLRSTVVDTGAGSTRLDHLCCESPVTPLVPSMSEEDLTKWRKSPRLYGTAQQTVILVDNSGRLKYVERTLYNREARPLDAKDQDIVVEFQIEGWPTAA